MIYKAKHDRIILKESSTSEIQVGRIVIPDIEQNKSEVFEVVATGPGAVSIFTGQYIPTQHQVGDKVYCKKAVMHELPELDGEKYYSTRDNEPLGYLVDEIDYSYYPTDPFCNPDE